MKKTAFRLLETYGTVRTFEGTVKGPKAVFFVGMKELFDIGFGEPDAVKFLQRILTYPDPIKRAVALAAFRKKFVEPFMQALRLKIIGRINLHRFLVRATILIVFLPYLPDVESDENARSKMEDDLHEAIKYYYNTMDIRLFGFGGHTSTHPTCANLFAKTKGMDILLLHGGYGTANSNVMIIEKVLEIMGRTLEDSIWTAVGNGAVLRPSLPKLARRAKKTIIVARNQIRLTNAVEKLLAELGPGFDSNRIKPMLTADINEAIAEANIVSLAANIADAKTLAIQPVKRVFIDFGVPPNATQDLVQSGVVIKGGVVRLPGRSSRVNGLPDERPIDRLFHRQEDTLYKQLGVPSPKEANACTCELASLILHLQDRSPRQFCAEHDLDPASLVKVDHDKKWIDFYAKIWSELGFNLSRLRSPTGLITQSDFDRIKELEQFSPQRGYDFQPAFEL